MPSKLPQPRFDAPIGKTASGEPVLFDKEWYRGFIASLRERTGGDLAMTNTELENLAQELYTSPVSDLAGQAAQRLADELHGEIASLRGSINTAVSRLEELALQLEGLSIPADLSQRVQSIEERLQ